jgi:hypothetical protein
MPKDSFEFDCPCCGKRVEVDVRSGRARAVKPQERRGGGDLDTLLDKHRNEAERLDQMFRDASERHREAPAQRERRLRDAIDEVGREPEPERPPNPFDLE